MIMSHQVTGHHTRWKTYVWPGCYFCIPGQKYAYRIVDVIDDRNLTLAVPYEDENIYEGSYMIFRPPKMWLDVKADKNRLKADGSDEVVFTLPVDTRVTITSIANGYRREEKVLTNLYTFSTTRPGTYHFDFQKPGYNREEIVITAEEAE